MSSLVLLAALAAVFVLVGSVGTCVLRLLAPFVPSLAARGTAAPRGAPWLFASLALGPWLVAAATTTALVAPAFDTACHCGDHGLHHPHFCLVHPSFASPVAAAALVVLGLWAALVAPRLVGLARRLAVARRLARVAGTWPLVHVDGVAVRLGHCGRAGALTVGLLSPCVVFDRELWRRLDGAERRAVVHHEAHHQRRRDPLTLFVLYLASSLALVPLGDRILRAWRHAAELACDAHAAERVGDGAEVAAALVSVDRWRDTIDGPEIGRLAALGVATEDHLERRVLTLLAAPPRRSGAARSDVLGVVLVGVVALALAAAWPGDALHHAVESAVGLFVR
ncbi:MAG: M56 family metallopeptidase [Myxococcales bacterium]|nr:M56 family metallopeptidase [Myxococcales bacterium]